MTKKERKKKTGTAKPSYNAGRFERGDNTEKFYTNISNFCKLILALYGTRLVKKKKKNY